jgi:hypothetical protein
LVVLLKLLDRREEKEDDEVEDADFKAQNQ